ncbi:MAG TPA: regulatory protein RecX [Candidatus Baltobacteraceae bacterium]|nr:regulatory protein RecX [Candidatus Baltobacteraceae bacterium]
MAGSARVTALRMLAQRRLTEAQLHARLVRKGFDDDAASAAVVSCKRDGLLDDALFATLYVEGKRAPVGDARLVGELVKRGIDRDAARERVAASDVPETERAATAYARMRRANPALSYQSAARKLERLGFPASLIYRVLRERAGADLGDALADPA